MMTSDKNTDQLFRRLNDLEEQPSSRVWDAVEARLDDRGRKRRLMPLLRWGAAAVVLLAAGLLWLFDGTRYLPVDSSVLYTQNEAPGVEKSTQKEDGDKSYQQMTDEEEDRERIGSSLEEGIEKTDEKIEKRVPAGSDDTYFEEQLAEMRSEGPISSSEAGEDLQKMNARPLPEFARTGTRIAKIPAGVSEEVVSTDVERRGERPKPVRTGRSFSIGGEYSPTYAFRDVSGPVSGGSRENATMRGGGGFNLALRINKRWKLETGVNFTSMGQEVNTLTRSDRVYSLSDATPGSGLDVTEVELSNTLGAIIPDASTDDPTAMKTFSSDAGEVIELSPDNLNGENNPLLEQSLGYVRLPFTLRYHIFNGGGMEFSLAGGFSTNWLIDNNAYLRSSGKRQYVGETNGISDMSMSSHAGIAVGIPVFKKVQLRMEPRVDYFISDISEDSPVRYRPYSFGVYTGVFYEF
ncbi:MAG: hypothetical protein R6U46_14695 [Marinilabilia sp.]